MIIASMSQEKATSSRNIMLSITLRIPEPSVTDKLTEDGRIIIVCYYFLLTSSFCYCDDEIDDCVPHCNSNPLLDTFALGFPKGPEIYSLLLPHTSFLFPFQ